MHRRIVSLLATGVLLASVGVLVGPGAAVAEDPPLPVPAEPMPFEEAPLPIVSPTSGPPGTVITVTLPECGGVVVAALANEEDVLVFTDGPGPTVQLTVPAGTPQGELVVVAGCDVYDVDDLNGVLFTVTAGAVVASPTLTG